MINCTTSPKNQNRHTSLNKNPIGGIRSIPRLVEFSASPTGWAITMSAVFVLTLPEILRTVLSSNSTAALPLAVALGISAVGAGTLAVGPLLRAMKENHVLYLGLLLATLMLSGLFANRPPELDRGILVDIFLRGLPPFVIAASFAAYRGALRALNIVGILLLLNTAFGMLMLREETFGYSQQQGYILLTSCVIFADRSLEKKRPFDILITLISGVLLVASGARGPLVCVALYLGLRILNSLRTTGAKIFIALLAGGLSLALATLDLRAATERISTFLEGMGLSTRAIDRIASGQFFVDDARAALAQKAADSIWSNWLLGVGPGNDRTLLGSYMTSSVEEYYGWYPHNFFLEIWLQFGIIFGSVLLLFVAAIMLRSLSRLTGESRRIAYILVAIGFFPLLFSGSYLTYPNFYLLMGYLLGLERLQRRGNSE